MKNENEELMETTDLQLIEQSKKSPIDILQEHIHLLGDFVDIIINEPIQMGGTLIYADENRVLVIGSLGDKIFIARKDGEHVYEPIYL